MKFVTKLVLLVAASAALTDASPVSRSDNYSKCLTSIEKQRCHLEGVNIRSKPCVDFPTSHCQNLYSNTFSSLKGCDSLSSEEKAKLKKKVDATLEKYNKKCKAEDKKEDKKDKKDKKEKKEKKEKTTSTTSAASAPTNAATNQNGTEQNGAAQNGNNQDATNQNGTQQAGAAQNGNNQAGATQTGINQPGAPQNGTTPATPATPATQATPAAQGVNKPTDQQSGASSIKASALVASLGFLLYTLF